MSDIRKTMEAYLEMVSEKKAMCEKCGKMHEGECEMDDDEKEMDEAKKLDPVDDAENDKPFAKRKDKDIDNDGDVDSSDEYLHKKRAATDDAIDGGKKPADNAPKKKVSQISKIGESIDVFLESLTEEQLDELSTGLIRRAKDAADRKLDDAEARHKKQYDKASDGGKKQYGDVIRNKTYQKTGAVVTKLDRQKQKFADRDQENTTTSQRYQQYRKDGGKLSMDDWKKRQRESFEIDATELLNALEEALNQKKGATAPEGMDDKESKSGKDFKAMHKVDVKTHDELERIEEPKERKVKKEMTEFEVIRALLSGKPTGE